MRDLRSSNRACASLLLTSSLREEENETICSFLSMDSPNKESRLMPHTTTPLDEFSVHVLKNEASPHGVLKLTLQFEVGRLHGLSHTPQAGQFLMLDVQDDAGFRFRRPYSLLTWNPETQIGEILYKVVGEGSQCLANWQVGQKSVALSSLGNAFPDVSPSSTLLIAGGVGLAPLLFWAEQGRLRGWQDADMPTLVYGVRTHAEADFVSETLQRIIPSEKLILCTDDGSHGWHGHAVHWLEHQDVARLQHFKQAFVCGPTPMMAGVVNFAQNNLSSMKVYVSLENHMPCGTGACFGCVVGAVSPHPPMKVCEAGPVLEASLLAWTPSGLKSGDFESCQALYPSLEVEEEGHSHA